MINIFLKYSYIFYLCKSIDTIRFYSTKKKTIYVHKSLILEDIFTLYIWL